MHVLVDHRFQHAVDHHLNHHLTIILQFDFSYSLTILTQFDLQHGYRAFLESMCPGSTAAGMMPPPGWDVTHCPRPVLGIYDDHDYGACEGVWEYTVIMVMVCVRVCGNIR